MTIQEFLQQLTRLRKAGQLRFFLATGAKVWKADGTVEYVTRPVRTIFPPDKPRQCRCPIEALGRALYPEERTQHRFVYEWRKRLGLSREKYGKVLRAADQLPPSPHNPGGYNRQLRADLLEACGLKEA